MARKGPAAESTASRSHADARQVQRTMNLLEAQFDAPAMDYREGWSDERIGEAAGVTAKQVERMRIRFFGPMKPTAGAGLPARVYRLEQQMASMFDIVELVADRMNIEISRPKALPPPAEPGRAAPTPPGSSGPSLTDQVAFEAFIVPQVAFEAFIVPLIREHGRPMTKLEIKGKMLDQGIRWPNFDSRLVNKLSNANINARFGKTKSSTKPLVYFPDQGYWLADQPWGPAKYQPKASD